MRWLDKAMWVRSAYILLWAMAPAIGGLALPAQSGENEAGSSESRDLGAVADERAADRAAIEERVNARWRALIAGDFRAAYEFEAPAYREATSYERFAARFGRDVVWRVARVVEIRYDSPEAAKVRVALDYQRKRAPREWGDEGQTTSYVEKWLKRDGQWWHRSDS